MPSSESDELPDDQHAAHSVSPRRKSAKRRRVLLILALLALVGLPAGLLVLNGPGFRTLGRLAALKWAEATQLQGDLTLDGSLWSGFRISELAFRPVDGDAVLGDDSTLRVERLEIGEASVDYRLPRLVTGAARLDWLESLRLEKATVHLRLPSARADDETPDEQPGPANGTEFHPLWNLLDAEIAIEDLTLLIRQGDSVYSLEGIGFHNSPGQGGSFELADARLPGEAPIGGLEVEWRRDGRSLTIGPVVMDEGARIERLTFAEPSPGAWTLDVEANIGGARLAATIDQQGSVSVELLRNGTLDLADALPDGLLPQPIGGRVTDLDLNFEGAFETPSSWNLDGTLVASKLSYGDFTLDSLAARLKQGKLSVEGRRPDTSVRLDVSAPLSRADSIEALASRPFDLAAGLETNSLPSLLSAFGVEAPLTGSTSLQVRNVQFFPDGRLRAGSLLLVSDDLAWNDVPLETSQLAANVEQENLVHIAGDFGLDADDRVRLTGAVDTADRTYEGEMNGTLSLREPLFRRLDLELPVTLAGAVDLGWKGSGPLAATGHEGTADVTVEELRINGGSSIDGAVEAAYEGETFRLASVELASGDLTLTGSGGWDGETFSLPGWKLADAEGERATLDVAVPVSSAENEEDQAPPLAERIGPVETTLAIDRLDVAAVAGVLQPDPPRSGLLHGRLTTSGPPRDLTAEGDIEFRPTFEKAPEDAALTAEFEFDGDVTRPADWRTRLDAVLSGLRWREAEIGDLNLDVQTRDGPQGRTLLGEIRFEQPGASLQGRTSLRLAGADTITELTERPLLADGSLSVEDVAPLWEQFAPGNLRAFPIAGALEAELTGLAIESGTPRSGKATVSSESLALAGETAALDLEATVTEPGRIAGDVTVAFDELSRLEGGGSYRLDEAAYEGSLDLTADLAGEGALKRLLSGRNIATLLPRVTRLTWSGSGRLREDPTHRGELDLAADDLALAGGSIPVDLRAKGSYDGTSADFPEISLASPVLDLAGAAAWRDHRLELTEWRGRSEGREVIAFSASAPLDPERLAPAAWFAQETPLSADVAVTRLPVDRVTRLFAEESPFRGDLSMDLQLGGSPALPEVGGAIDLAGISLETEDEPMPLGEARLEAATKERTLTLAGDYRHPDVNPLSLDAEFPLRPGDWVTGERAFGDEPVSLRADMDRSSLGFLATRVPGIESIEGAVAVDAEVSGTPNAPQIRGSGLLDIARLRFEDRNAPSIYDVDLDARFADNRLSVERLRAIVAGGILEGSGAVRFGAGREPVLDFTLEGQEVLVVRTPDLNIRSDVSLALAGPWSRARLSGEVGLVNSRFFKNFDLLPVSLPTGGSSALPEVESSSRGGASSPADLDIGVPLKPFSDWPVNVRLHTATPFKVRSNLVQSAIEADLRLTGTLGEPIPNGQVSVAEGELTLPFSDVDVEIGRVEFDRSTGFNGALEFKARAKADQYRINIFLYDRLFSPKYVLTSVPPMPSEDIMTLLATGTTRSELIGEDAGSKAASKAATLFFKNLRKVSAAETGGSSLLDELEERTELDMGGVNPETGEHTFGGKIRLWKQLFFVGDVTRTSNYRAFLKYVFRFR